MKTAEFAKEELSSCKIVDFIRESAAHYRLKPEATEKALALAKRLMAILSAHTSDSATVRVSVSRRRLAQGRVYIECPGDEIDFAREYARQIGNPGFDGASAGADAQEYLDGMVLDAQKKDFRYQYKNGKNCISLAIVNVSNMQLYVTLSSFVVGIALGLLCRLLFSDNVSSLLVGYVFSPITTIFINGLKMAVGPVVFLTLVACISKIDILGSLGKIGFRAVRLYLLIFVCAAAIATAVSFAGHIGDPALAGAILSLPLDGGEAPVLSETPLLDTIVGIVPDNIVQPFFENDMLSILFLAVLVGAVLSVLKFKVRSVLKLVDEIYAIFLKMVEIVTVLLPFAIVSNVTMLIIQLPPNAIVSILAWAVALLATSAALMLAFILMVVLIGRLNPLPYVGECLHLWLTANTIGSSTAMIPKAMELCERMGVDSNVYSLLVPLGTSVNKAGSHISNLVTTFFLCGIFSIVLSPQSMVALYATVFLMGIAAPPVNGGGIVIAAAVFAQAGIPACAIAFYMIINPIVDLTITGMNVLGNVVVPAIVSCSRKRP